MLNESFLLISWLVSRLNPSQVTFAICRELEIGAYKSKLIKVDATSPRNNLIFGFMWQ
jgi:hypothetical protein